MQKKVFALIKVLSIVLISGAIGLEGWNIYARLHHGALPSRLNFAFWFGSFALSIHAIEGIIAAAYAPSRQKPPLQYGIYTLFVGTVGLFELFDSETNQTTLM
ncbi:MAG: hypothetical protein QNJ46_05380 [Leptolyngbyaceae cyanobacterium MO_188.B28]|nr:hypothetical protein [Leptolyngbyaceae cyanobacterium MO_188.B28]